MSQTGFSLQSRLCTKLPASTKSQRLCFLRNYVNLKSCFRDSQSDYANVHRDSPLRHAQKQLAGDDAFKGSLIDMALLKQ